MTVGPHTLRIDAYSASRAACHIGQYDLDCASTNEARSDSVPSVVYITFGFEAFLVVLGVAVDVAGLFCGKLLLVLGIKFRIIRGPNANAFGIFSSIDFTCRILLTSVSANDVRKFGFIVKVFGTVKVKG